MKLFLLVILINLAATAKGQYIYQIINEENQGVYYDAPGVLTDTHLLYQTLLGNDINLWSMDLVSKKKEQIIESNFDTDDDEDSSPVKYIEAYQGKVYFAHTNNDYSSNDYGSYLWSTDGTKAGTKKVSSLRLNYEGQFGVFNNELFAINLDDYLVQLHNDTLVTHDIKFPSVVHICVYSQNDFIVQSRNSAADTFTLSRVTGTTITELYTYHSTYDDDAYFSEYDGGCLFTHTTEGERKAWFTPLVGESQIIAMPNDSSFEQLAVIENRIFVTSQNNGYTGKVLSRLSEDLLTFDHSIEFSDFSVSSISPQNHLLSVVIKDNNSGWSSHAFYDVNLNQVNSIDLLDRNLIEKKFKTDTKVISVFNHYYYGALIQLIDNDNNITLHSIKDHSISNIISNPNSSEYYLVLFDKSVGKSNIFSLTETPTITQAINGTWHEYDIPNQGIVIHAGKRHDNTEYLFATLFVIDEGVPLWLAGNSDLSLGQMLINFPVYKYQGINFFEPNITPDQESFGEITITLTDCNTMHFTIESDQHNQSQSLYRINDTSFDSLCGKVDTLDLSVVNTQSGQWSKQ